MKWGSGLYASFPLYAKLDMGEGFFISLLLSEEFGNVGKIGVRTREGKRVVRRGLNYNLQKGIEAVDKV